MIAAHLLLPLLAMQASVQVPATPGPELPPLSGPYSIVVARAVKQYDPLPIDCGTLYCTSWFLGDFDQTRNVAGEPLPSSFSARIEMGSPFIQQYVQAYVVEHLPNGALRVREVRGFHWETRQACFDRQATEQLSPTPTGPALSIIDGKYCVAEE